MALNRYRFRFTFFIALLVSLSSVPSLATEHVFEKRTDPLRVVDLSGHYPSAFTFAALGDSGWGSAEQYAVSDRMDAASPDFIVHTGDVVYKRGRWKRYEERFVNPYKKLLDKGVVFYPVPGNHDYYSKGGEAYFRYFSYLPGNYYAIETGLVDFFALDTNIILKGDGEQLRWLRARLENSDATYKVVYMHHPFFTSGDHGEDGYPKPLEATLRPIFEAGGVSLVLTGHDHNYERLGPVGGVTYIVTGGGGKDLRMKGKVESPHSKLFKSAHHFLTVTVTEESMKVEAVGVGGKVIDSIVIDAIRAGAER